jgi:hypothetical protein
MPMGNLIYPSQYYGIPMVISHYANGISENANGKPGISHSKNRENYKFRVNILSIRF